MTSCDWWRGLGTVEEHTIDCIEWCKVLALTVNAKMVDETKMRCVWGRRKCRWRSFVALGSLPADFITRVCTHTPTYTHTHIHTPVRLTALSTPQLFITAKIKMPSSHRHGDSNTINDYSLSFSQSDQCSITTYRESKTLLVSDTLLRLCDADT